jgi:hypothetical protein
VGTARGAAVWLAPPADAEPTAIPPIAAIGSMKRSVRYHREDVGGDVSGQGLPLGTTDAHVVFG